MKIRNIKQLKELINDLPDNMKVYINYHTWDDLSWVEECIDYVVVKKDENELYLCGEDKDEEEE